MARCATPILFPRTWVCILEGRGCGRLRSLWGEGHYQPLPLLRRRSRLQLPMSRDTWISRHYRRMRTILHIMDNPLLKTRQLLALRVLALQVPDLKLPVLKPPVLCAPVLFRRPWNLTSMICWFGWISRRSRKKTKKNFCRINCCLAEENKKPNKTIIWNLLCKAIRTQAYETAECPKISFI